MFQPLRIRLTSAPGRHTLHRPLEATQEWDGQKASSCEQPVDVTRAGDGAPLASTSCRKTALELGRPSQPTSFLLVDLLASPSHRITDETLLFL